MQRIMYSFFIALCFMMLSSQAIAQCTAGTMTTTDPVTLCSLDETFDINVDDAEIPATGGYGYSFTNLIDNTGPGGGAFTLSSSSVMETYDADLSGVLSANGLPPLNGTWSIFGFVYDDAANPTASICELTADSIVVNFSALSVNGINNGDGSATAVATGGVQPYTYAWADGQTTQTAVDLPMGDIEVTVTDAVGCVGTGVVTVSSMADPCETWLNPNPTGGFVDFNTAFGGAPCDDGNGCPFNEIQDFEVFASEAYAVNGFVAGGTYTFSICNGPNAGSWIPEFTIIDPDGEVVAFGEGDGDDCSITWTATIDGTYLIVINEAGECGGGPNTATPNGFPALTCENGTACPIIICEAGTLLTTGEITLCDGDVFDLEVTDVEIPANGGFGYFFDNSLGGTGGLPNPFPLTGAPQMVSYDNTLNGVLPANMLDNFTGTWIIKSVVYSNADDANGSICSFSQDSLIVNFVSNPEVSVVDNGDGSATATPSGGEGPYSYLWEDGQASETATDLEEGLITVTVTDANGCTVEGQVNIEISSVANIEVLDALTIAPNPSNGLFNINVELTATAEVSLEVYDLVGRNIQNVDMGTMTTSTIEVNLQDRPTGVYLLKLNIDGQSITRRLMKN